MTQEITQISQHTYDTDSEQYPQLTTPSLKELTLDYRVSDTTRDILQQLSESNRATSELLHIIYKKLHIIERQNQMILDLFQSEMGCEEVHISFADVGMTDDQVKEQVLIYYQTKGECYPSDVAYALNFNLERVVHAVHLLEKEGVLEG